MVLSSNNRANKYCGLKLEVLYNYTHENVIKVHKYYILLGHPTWVYNNTILRNLNLNLFGKLQVVQVLGMSQQTRLI